MKSASSTLLAAFAAANASRKPASSTCGSSSDRRSRSPTQSIADGSSISALSGGLQDSSQRRGVTPLVSLTMRSGCSSVQFGEDRLLHQIGVQRGDAVDLVRHDEGQFAHLDLAILDDAHLARSEG
jgi:hypothetical protein